jgi:protein-disulfide isomerase
MGSSRRLRVSTGLVAICLLLWAQTGSGQQPTTADLKKDIDALQTAVNAIQKELQEIKALLQGRQPEPPQNVVLDISNRPFKGERTAKLTLVEFSDYE